jgi:stage II sporulation protein D
MNFIYKIALGIGVAVCSTHAQMHLPVRTVLAQHAVHAKRIHHFCAEQGFKVLNPATPHKIREFTTPVLSLTTARGTLVLNGTNTLSKKLIIKPRGGTFTYAGTVYAGSLIITCDGKRLVISAYTKQSKQELLMPSKPKGASTHKQAAACERISHEHAYNVRVLLDECADSDACLWRIASADGFMLVDPENPTQRVTMHESEVTLRDKHGRLYVNGKRYKKNQIYLIPRSGKSTFNGKTYLGSFLMTRHQDKWLLINSLEIEDYVYCVLKTESWPGWPLEVNKAFAIASRTYVIAMVFRAKATKLPYHIKNTNAHQTYAGHHDSPVLDQAVQETHGIFLAHNNQPIVAMFDICCGGIIPAQVPDIDFVKAPYLQRTYPCTHCRPTKMYAWQVQYSLNEITALLKQEYPHIKRIKQIKVGQKNKAGLVRNLVVHTSKNIISIPGKRIRSVLKRIKSLCFTVTRHGDTFIFKGRGRGHHMGICQWGAREMVRKGYDYKEILEFYYHKTSFMKLS